MDLDEFQLTPPEEIDRSDESTIVYAIFAGKRRRFQLTIGGVQEVERICKAGIGAIMLRIGSHSFYHDDIWQPIRLGLEGGGATEAEASALVLRYEAAPIRPYMNLAGFIVSSHVNGAPFKKKIDVSSQESEQRETYQSSTQSVEDVDLVQSKLEK